MFKLFKYIQYFFVYCIFVYKHKNYLHEKFGLSYNLFFEVYTTINISEVEPELLARYGYIGIFDMEVKKYHKMLSSDLDRFGMVDLFKNIEIKEINKENVGIAYGYRYINNRKFILTALLAITALIALPIILL